VLRDPDFKQEFGRVITAMIRAELEKVLPSTNPQTYVQPPPTPVAAPQPNVTENLVKDVPTGTKSTIELKSLVEREFPGSELQLWKYYDQKGNNDILYYETFRSGRDPQANFKPKKFNCFIQFYYMDMRIK